MENINKACKGLETKRQRVSDIITFDEIDKWKSGDNIIINSGTGSGKSYFVKNVLYTYAKMNNQRILLLEHRKNCKDQFVEEIKQDGKQDVITVMTYQSVETAYLNNHLKDLTKFDYIFCDEYHYFSSDSEFNHTTDISLKAILNCKKAIKIFSSATGGDMTQIIQNYYKMPIKEYELPMSYDFIKSLSYFKQDETLVELAKNIIRRNEKAIFFVYSAKKAYNLFDKFKDYAIFNCSQSNEKYYKYVNQDLIDEMLKNEKFDKPILITTLCLDAGVNIIDKSVRNIIISDVKDIDIILQCIGRRRIDFIDEKDGFNLYVKEINNQQIGGLIRNTERSIEMAEYLMRHNTQEFLKKYPRDIDYTKIIYDEPTDDKDLCIKKVNELMFFKKCSDITRFKKMLKKWGIYAFNKEIAFRLGFYEKTCYGDEFLYSIIYGDYTLKRYLEENVNKVFLQVKDRKDLINKIDVHSDGKKLKSLSSLNAALTERNIPYQIKEFETCRRENGSKKKFKHAWKIVAA